MKRRAFPGYGPEVEARYQRAGQWLLATIYQNDKAIEWCKQNGVAIVKAAGETVGSSGGFLVPTDLANAILDIRDTYGAFRRTARLLPMASDSTSVPRRNGSTTTFFIGENTSGAGGNETGVSADQVSLTARKIGSLVRISSELEADAVADIVDYVANEIGFAFALQEDDCAFNGNGTSTYGRMRGIGSIVLDGVHNKAKVTAASGHNTFATIDRTDLTNLMAAVLAAAVSNAAWFASQTAFALTFCGLQAGTVGGVLETRLLNGIVTPYYLGFPIILTQKLPLVTTSLTGQVMLAFGDMYAGALLGQRRGITLARSEDRYLDQDEIAVLGTQRFHSVIHGLGDNQNFGMLAALVGG